ncbi:MAG: MerR family transcriptional regulator [Ramlibacter sp.]|jgi:DNA-binding transcriptional MerR regulator|nr:MerR family transcriptional regulator [Ramlibacter sp.]
MQLKVGELARSTGLTVRTLHHYDEIGLLKPSGRSESGYRMYGEADVARLHAIQALRYLGLPLAEIAPLLDGENASIEAILEQQMRALQQQIRQATELHDRLSLLHAGLLKGRAPEVGEWVRSLALMATYGKYFTAGELKQILVAYTRIEREWLLLLDDVRAYLQGGGTIETEQAQVLTRRWMGLMVQWMDGDFALMERWGAMYRSEPSAHGIRGAPSTEVMEFMERAIAFRVGLLRQHFEERHLKGFRPVPDADYEAIELAGRSLLQAGKPATGAAARALARRWLALLDQAAGGDADLRARMQTLHTAHPLLLAGSPVSREVREYLMQATSGA